LNSVILCISSELRSKMIASSVSRAKISLKIFSISTLLLEMLRARKINIRCRTGIILFKYCIQKHTTLQNKMIRIPRHKNPVNHSLIPIVYEDLLKRTTGYFGIIFKSCLDRFSTCHRSTSIYVLSVFSQRSFLNTHKAGQYAGLAGQDNSSEFLPFLQFQPYCDNRQYRQLFFQYQKYEKHCLLQ